MIDWHGLARQGFSIFPVKKFDKQPLVKWKDFQQRRPTEAEVDQWGQADTNVGIATGAISGIVVLDIDTDEGEAFVRERGIPRTPTVKTSKGRHIYFRHPGFEVRNFAGKITGCDLRGDGGYVVGPGSAHETGVVYTHEIGFDTPLADMPGWLRKLIQSTPPTIEPIHRPPGSSPWAEKALDSELATLRRAAEGTRNDQLNKSAFSLGQIVGGGHLNQGEVERHLLGTANAIGLTDHEARATVTSGLTEGMEQPRHPPERGAYHQSSKRPTARPAHGNVIPIEQARAAPHGEPSFAFKPIDPIHWQDTTAPSRQWLWQDWIPDHNVTLLYGEGGTGKSLLVQQLATSVALGLPFAGAEIPRRKVLAVFCEDGEDELHRRQEAINARFECDHADLEDLRFFSRPGDDNILMTFDAAGVGLPTEIYEAVRREALEFGAGLIVWDTVSDGFAGNENIRPQVRQFMSLFTRLARDIDGAVLLCAHPSVSGRATGEAGSTQWSNSARSRLYLTRPEGDDVDQAERQLSRKKANYATSEDVIDLRWNDGAFVIKQKMGGVVGSIERNNADRAFLEAMDRLDQMGMTCSPALKSGDTYAPKIMRQYGGASAFKEGDLAKAMARLLRDGLVRVEEKNRRKSLVRTHTQNGDAHTPE